MIAGNKENRLAIELAFYAEHKAEWLNDHSGKYVVAQNRNILGFYDSFETAFTAGVMGYGVERDFLVKQVLPREPTYFVY